jgi:hypothetical protein
MYQIVGMGWHRRYLDDTSHCQCPQMMYKIPSLGTSAELNWVACVFLANTNTIIIHILSRNFCNYSTDILVSCYIIFFLLWLIVMLHLVLINGWSIEFNSF